MAVLGVISPLTVRGQFAGHFVHPGALETQADFDRMKAKVQVGEHPWIDSWNILIGNNGAQTSYLPHAQGLIIRGSGCGTQSYQFAMWDAAAAYQLSLRWKSTGNNAYADTAVNILNAWANACTNICGSTDTGPTFQARLLPPLATRRPPFTWFRRISTSAMAMSRATVGKTAFANILAGTPPPANADSAWVVPALRQETKPAIESFEADSECVD